MWVTNNRERSMINNNLMNARPLKSIKSDRRWRVQEFKSLLVWIGNVAERRNNSSRVEKTIRKFISVARRGLYLSIGEIERPESYLLRRINDCNDELEKVDIYNGWVLSWRPFLFIWNSPESIRPSVSSLHHVVSWHSTNKETTSRWPLFIQELVGIRRKQRVKPLAIGFTWYRCGLYIFVVLFR